MKKSILIYNVHLLDANIQSQGAVLLCGGKIEEVFLGDYCTVKKARSLVNADCVPSGIADGVIEISSANVEKFASMGYASNEIADCENCTTGEMVGNKGTCCTSVNCEAALESVGENCATVTGVDCAKFAKSNATDECCAVEFYDGKDLTLMPAFVDMHVHLRYPGQTQKEDLESGLKAAVAGGVATVIAMPNTNPVVSSEQLAKQIDEEAKALNLANIFQTLSITKNFDGKDTSHLDCVDCKIIPVITEDGHDVLDSSVMLEAMQKAAKNNCIVSCHCEDVNLCQTAKPFRKKALELMEKYDISTCNSFMGGLQKAFDSATENVEKEDSKNILDCDKENLSCNSVVNQIVKNLCSANEVLEVAEDSCTERNLLLAEIAKCKIHIAHCSTKKSIEAVVRAKKRQQANGFSVSCEVTAHHLALTGTKFPEICNLVNPPLRSEEDRLALIQALADETADVISTDHAPHTSDDKINGAPGFSGIETSYAVCNTVLVVQNKFSPKKLSKLMSYNPAKILNLNKGLLQKGYDADLVLVNPTEKWIVHGEDFFSKGKFTPFENAEVVGRVKETFVSGKKVFSRI